TLHADGERLFRRVVRPVVARGYGTAGVLGVGPPRGRAAVRNAAGWDPPDAWAFRSCRRPAGAGRGVGRAGVRASARTAVPDGAVLVSAAGPDRGRRRAVVAI